MNTFETLADICHTRLGQEMDSITPDATFAELGADSLDLVDFIMEVESVFDIEIPDEELEKFKNLGDVAKYIEEN